MARKVKYKLNKEGFSTTRCPNGFTTLKGNRPKRAGDDCLFCKYRVHVDYDEHIVTCSYVKPKKE